MVGIVEPDNALRERAKSLAPYKDVPWMTQEQLLNTPGLQAVLVETRVRDLLNTAETCVAAGKHVHLDKPAGESLPQFERILNTAQQKKLLLQMGYMYRYNPAVVLLREFLKQGWLGDVFEIHTVMSKVLSAADRQSHAEHQGGMMFELGCHIIDLVVGVLGEPTAITSFNQHASPHHDTLVDNMLAVLQYPKAIASVKSSAKWKGASPSFRGLWNKRDVSYSAAGRSFRSHCTLRKTGRVPSRLSGCDFSQIHPLHRRCGRHGPCDPWRKRVGLPHHSRLSRSAHVAKSLSASARQIARQGVT